MSPIARYHNILTNIDADVTRAERLLADALADVATRQENRQGVCGFEKRVRDIRFELENLWTLRRQHVGQAATQDPLGFVLEHIHEETGASAFACDDRLDAVRDPRGRPGSCDTDWEATWRHLIRHCFL